MIENMLFIYMFAVFIKLYVICFGRLLYISINLLVVLNKLVIFLLDVFCDAFLIYFFLIYGMCFLIF